MSVTTYGFADISRQVRQEAVGRLIGEDEVDVTGSAFQWLVRRLHRSPDDLRPAPNHRIAEIKRHANEAERDPENDDES